MRCPKCGKDVELQKRQVGVDANGKPVFNEYAVCRDCKKQWNLDKQRAKKAAEAAASNHKGTLVNSVKNEPKAEPKKKVIAPKEEKPASASAPAPEHSGRTQSYGNIPPEKVRKKREKAMKQNYEDMLASDPRKRTAKSKRPADTPSITPKKKAASSQPAASRKKAVSQPSAKSAEKRGKPKPRFKILRIIFGIVSIIAFGLFTYKGLLAGLNNISSGNNSSSGLTYIILALCMLVSGLLLFIMRTKRTIFAFILPMLFYIGGAVCAFLRRGNERWLLFGALAGLFLAVVFLILTIASRSGNNNYEYDDDYDDPFEEDHDNY
ncbi:hypothetical protein [Clostridium sp. C105KSO13]|uniref:hypothetical protein n=1 Tax=Clostridium sp. C105KSO13 TaxID=1776045 RepID=UPI00074077DC|nr:hypothetical protein [Clostridium sp. C105KSO13]CUX46743.1 hypothetical protein BN3456_02633 [Clostridium sp. C105KSO13]